MKAVNLIPSDDRAGGVGVGAGRSGGAAYAVLGLFAGLVVLALIYGLARHQASSRKSQLASIAARTQHAHESASALGSYTSFMTMREQRVQAVDQLVSSRFDWAHALHELGRVMPFGASITSFDGSVHSGTTGATGGSSTSSSGSSGSSSSSVGSATPPGSVPTFTLGGCATSQAEVAQALERLRLIDGVSNVTLLSSTRSSSAGAGASASSCGHGPAFTAQLTFDALPSAPSAGKSGAELTSSTGGER
ncbi:MAG TPA: hypothetical protein VK707_04075 [Solirubrobacteraceae bacterium]|jgi:hypothetical protein|nr:hypothetical protein [Solirubrobacteraceae bacterium]